MNPTDTYRRARDQLLTLHGRHDAAVEQFRWPNGAWPNWTPGAGRPAGCGHGSS